MTLTDAQESEASYADWLRARLHKINLALDSGEMESYPNEIAKAVLQARLEVRRNKLNLPI